MSTENFSSRRVSCILLTLGGLAAVACNRGTQPKPSDSKQALSASAAPPAPAPPAVSSAVGVTNIARETPILVGGQKTGYSRLDDERIVRTEQLDCPITTPRKEFECHSPTHGGCAKDTECTANANGYCNDIADGTGCNCRYGCQRDADCKAGEVCLCGEPAGTCVASTCTNESCAAPSRCSSYHNLCFYVPFACLDRVGSRECSFSALPRRH
jgi:hypothetical protein